MTALATTHVAAHTVSAPIRTVDLYREIARKYPRASESKLMARFIEAMEDPDNIDFARAAYRRVFELDHKAETRAKELATPATRRAVKKAREKVKAAEALVYKVSEDFVKERILSGKTKINVLELLTPIGKQLGDCTGKECAKMGGQFTRLGGALKPRQKVSSLGAGAVAKLWK